MQLRTLATDDSGRPSAYRLELSSDDTKKWCEFRPGTGFNGQPIIVEASRYMVEELLIGGKKSIDHNEYALLALLACVLPAEYRHLWPIWAK